MTGIDGETGLSRRRLLSLSTMAAGLGLASLTGCAQNSTPGSATPGSATGSATGSANGSATGRVSAPPATGILAANVNQDLQDTNFAELQAVSATWLRGFYPIQNADQGSVAAQPGIQKLMTAVDQGYGTVLNLKFDYGQGLPTPGSAAFQQVFDRLTKVFAVLLGKVDILVVGNEPFFECSKSDRTTPAINQFYEAVAAHTIAARNSTPGASQTQIFLGALTELDSPQPDELPQINRWLDYAKGTPDIAGTDCHPHVAALSDGQKYVNYVLPRLRPDQKFLATEFSLVKFFKQHLTDPVPAAFANRYGISGGTLVWQVVQQAIAHPFPQAEWNDFLTSCPWFAGHQDFLTNMVAAFRKTGRLAVAGYGITQDTAMVSDFGPTSTPWVFNSLFCPYTTQPGPDGLPGQNSTWTTEFRALQQNG